MKELDLEKQVRIKEEDDILISVQNISKRYSLNLKSSLKNGIKDIFHELFFRRKQDFPPTLRKDEFWALQNVSFELRRGESLAIIGGNGAGKSTLLKLLYGLIKPDAGEIHIRGTLEAIIEINSGLNYILSGRENIYVKAALLGLTQVQTESIIEQVIDFAEVEEFIDSPVQFYSSGMIARLSFAISICLNPEILLVDEVLAVGDLAFQRKCTNHILKYLSSGGSIILISHDSNHIQSICQRGILLENGNISFTGTSIEALDEYFKIQLKKVNITKTVSADSRSNEKGLLKIEKVIIEPVQGEFIQSDEDCQIRVKYVALNCIDNFIWGFSIWTPDNFVNIAGNYNLTPGIIQQGEGELSCLIPAMPLAPGMYLLKVAISDLTTLHPLALSGWIDTPIEFTVNTAPNLLANSLQSINQLVKLNVRWF